MSQKTWGGRFTGDTDDRVEAFTESISFDRRLYRQDMIASQAHARMLAEVGLLSADEADAHLPPPSTTSPPRSNGATSPSPSSWKTFTPTSNAALIERLGDVGRKLHTGRSRNDQVVTDVKLWVRDAIDRLDGLLRDLQSALLASAERDRELVLPGYTHMQRAQPVLAAHYFLAYVEKYQRDRDRLADCRKRVNVLPLGAAALAGTSLPIDRDSVRRQLGFDALAANSLDVSSDRDFVLEFVFDLAVIALHLSGWAEEWVLWTTTEFGFLDLPDAFCTGSSIMPHKKNPDVLELIRGKAAPGDGRSAAAADAGEGAAARVQSRFAGGQGTRCSTPTTPWPRRWSWRPPLVRETRFRKEVIAARLEDGFLDATTLMEHLIAQGMPMRAAHEAVGKLVRLCEERRCRLGGFAGRGLRKRPPGPGAGGIQGVGRGQRAGGVPQRRLDGAGGGGPTTPAWTSKLATTTVDSPRETQRTHKETKLPCTNVDALFHLYLSVLSVSLW